MNSPFYLNFPIKPLPINCLGRYTLLMEEKLSTPLLDGHDYKPVKTCPKCKSVFVTDSECEGCGFQLSYTPLGEAFGEKSLYGLKDDYWMFRSRLVKQWPSLERKNSTDAIKYKRDLLHRYELLLNFLLGESDEDRSFYWIEFKDLCIELCDYSLKPSELSQMLNDHSFHGYAPLIHDFLEELDHRKLTTSTLWERFVGYKVLGILRIKFLILSGIALAAISTASILVYQYFLLFT